MRKKKTVNDLRDKRHFSVSAIENEIRRLYDKLGESELNEIDLAWLNGAIVSLRWTIGGTTMNPNRFIDWWKSLENGHNINFNRKAIMTTREYHNT